MQKIIQHFEKYFEIIIANTPELIQESRKLRYQVFCIENQYLDAEQNVNSCEFDRYDYRSCHSLIRHRDSGEYAATVRIVLPDKNNITNKFPMETLLKGNCYNEYNALMHAPRDQVAEVSRFLISKQFRQRVGDSSITGISGDFGMLSNKIKRQFTAQISLGLFKAIAQMSASNNIKYWLAIMEPSLIRLLARIGVQFRHLSDSIQYCGDRHVCFENATEISLGIKRQRPDLWEFFTEEGTNTFLHNAAFATPPPQEIRVM